MTTTAVQHAWLAGIVEHATPFLFFTGKGGVGKTSCASTTAVALADAGRRVLIVSTDPASNLPEVLGVTGDDDRPVAVPDVPGLVMLDLDPTAAASRYRDTVVGPYRGLLPPEAVAQIEEELSGPCTVEVAAFNEFVRLLVDDELVGGYDHVVFDTAPTGHTLRLLSLPAAWDGFLESNTGGITCVGPVSALGQTQESYADGLDALRDGSRTTVVLVARPDDASLTEASRASGELTDLGMLNQRLVVNGVLGDPDDDALAQARSDHELAALAAMPELLRRVWSGDEMPLLARAPLGVDALRAAAQPCADEAETPSLPPEPPSTSRLVDLVDAVAAAGPGIVMTMGKGGVGKTTVAAAIALALAERGLPVTLTTTDPAAHVELVLQDPPANLHVTRIDPSLETTAYTAQVMDEAGSQLDPAARDLLEEDLRSPCTEEVAVFHAFARAVAQAEHRWVVIDTAPTGHTLLLLQSSHSFVAQEHTRSGDLATSDSARLYERLSNPDRTRIVLLTLPQATPVHEARALQEDLARTGLVPWTWVVNAALSQRSTHHRVLAAQSADEVHRIAEVAELSPRPPVVLPWTDHPPIGRPGLHALLTPTGS